MAAKLYQLRVRHGNAVRETIDIGIYDEGGGHFDEQLWLWERIARLSADRHKEAQVAAKAQTAADRKREAKLTQVREWLTEMQFPAKMIERTVKTMRRYNEDHKSWDLFRSIGRTKAQSSSGEGGSG